jgi:hypothetical protein
MADLPPEHGSAKAQAGLIVRIVAKRSVIVSAPRWLRRLLLDLESCVPPREMIRRMASSPLVFALEAIRTPEPCYACFG